MCVKGNYLKKFDNELAESLSFNFSEHLVLYNESKSVYLNFSAPNACATVFFFSPNAPG